MSTTPKHWQGRGALALLLWPVSRLFGALAHCRRWCYHAGILKVSSSALPVVVVGNISVGGTGKTPLTQALVHCASKQGLHCGIVSRGHGGQAQSSPLMVDNKSAASVVGDEPLLHHYKTGVPVVVCTDRSAAVNRLAQCDVDIAFSDDGLQHYRMQRACEIAVVDADVGFANAMLLPSGPLREPVARLSQVDIVAVQISAPSGTHPNLATLLRSVPQLQVAADAGVPIGSFCLRPSKLRHLWTRDSILLSALSGKTVTAVAGIGSPERFFQVLRDANLSLKPMSFGDHHAYTAQDFQAMPSGLIIVTGKDAVKIQSLSLQQHDIYELEVDVEMNASLLDAIQAVFQSIKMNTDQITE